jgi:hypothetical protein
MTLCKNTFIHFIRRGCVGATLCLAGCLSGCDIDDKVELCDYNTRVDFYYAKEGQVNVLPYYIHQISDYLFDSNETLIQIMERSSSSTLDYAGLTLPVGSYTLVSWGNRGDASPTVPAKVGESTLSEMQLYLDNPYNEASKAPVAVAEGFHQNGDKLYYGKCSFEVKPIGINRGRVDMTHSYLRLGVTVKWAGKAPSDTLRYHMELCSVSGAYQFIPKYELPNTYLPQGYAPSFYSIPNQGNARVNHRVDTQMGITRSLSGEFITHRLTNSDHPVFCLYGNDRAVIKEIDLHKYFSTMQIDLDQNLRQEFDLVMEVQPNGTVIVSSLKVVDWNEGESIGAQP